MMDGWKYFFRAGDIIYNIISLSIGYFPNFLKYNFLFHLTFFLFWTLSLLTSQLHLSWSSSHHWMIFSIKSFPRDAHLTIFSQSPMGCLQDPLPLPYLMTLKPNKTDCCVPSMKKSVLNNLMNTAESSSWGLPLFSQLLNDLSPK